MREHPITWSLIIANTVVFLLIFSMPEPMRDQVISAFAFDPSHIFEVWRFFTFMFVHGSASHLFFNMLALFFFGKLLEEKDEGVRPAWYIAIYFVSGVMGAIASLLTSPAPGIGASGAIFGVMGAVMLLRPLKKIHLYILPLPAAFVAITFVIAETFLAYFQPDYGNVAHIAHIGGILTGSIFAYFYDPKRAVKGSLFLVISVVLLIVLGSVVSLISGLGDIIWSFVEIFAGTILYGIAGLLSFLWH